MFSLLRPLALLGIERSIQMLSHHQIAVLCFMPREVIFFRFFGAILSWTSIAEGPVAIPPDVLETAHPAAIPPPEPPAGGEKPTLPA